jgi:hypothetical protein
MGLHVLLSDRRADEALPALGALLLDLKTEELSVAAVPEVLALRPEVLLVDAGDNPGQGHAVLRAVRDLDQAVPTVVVVERRDLERFPWETLADDLLYPGAPQAEIRVRLAMLRRRAGRSRDRRSPGTARLGRGLVRGDGGRPGASTSRTKSSAPAVPRRAPRARLHSPHAPARGLGTISTAARRGRHVRRLRAKLGEHEPRRDRPRCRLPRGRAVAARRPGYRRRDGPNPPALEAEAPSLVPRR